MGTDSHGDNLKVLDTGTARGGHATGDTFENIENVIGSPHADRLNGSAGADRLNGGARDDVLTGGSGTTGSGATLETTR